MEENIQRKLLRVPFRSFAPFLLISFGLAWSIVGLYVFLPEHMVAVFGQLTGDHPLFYLAVYSPAIAAFILVARTGGIVGLRSFLGRALLWRCSAAWYAFLIMGIPLIFIVGSICIHAICIRGVGPRRHQGPDGGIRLEGTRTSTFTKEISSAMGWVGSWSHMGAVASASFPIERNSAE